MFNKKWMDVREYSALPNEALEIKSNYHWYKTKNPLCIEQQLAFLSEQKSIDLKNKDIFGISKTSKDLITRMKRLKIEHF